MAVMDSVERSRVFAQIQRDGFCPGDITKSELQDAVDAADAWADAQAVAFNLSLPVAFRSAASATQKALLLCFVIQRRVGRLPTAEG